MDPTKPAKVQAFQALDKLRAVMPIDRARMRLLVEVPEACEAEARDLVRSCEGPTAKCRAAWHPHGLIYPGPTLSPMTRAPLLSRS